MERVVKELTSVDDLFSVEDISLVPESTIVELLVGSLNANIGEVTIAKRTTAESDIKDSLTLAPSTVKPVKVDDSNAAVFDALEIQPGQELSADAFESLVQTATGFSAPQPVLAPVQKSAKAGTAQTSAASASSLLSFNFTVAYDPFAPELELYLGSYDSVPFPDNDPFPTFLLATAAWPFNPVPSFGTDSFINGRGSNVGFKVDLQGNQVSIPGSTKNLLPGYNNVAGTNATDKIRGNSGDNILFGFDGDDVFLGSGGSDKIGGGNGYDTIDYTGSGAAVTIGQFGLITKSTGGVDALQGDAFNPLTATVEQIIGDQNQTNDINVAGAPSDIEVDLAVGFLNIASVTGGGNNGDFDIKNFVNVTGGFGNDTIIGNNKANKLVTGAVSSDPVSDNDQVDAAAGNDVIVGGSGLDLLLGGTGADDFILGSGSQVYYKDNSFLGVSEYASLNDFQSGVDTIDLAGPASDYVFLGFGGVNTLILHDVDSSGNLSFSDDLIAYVPTGFNGGDIV